MAKSKIRIRLKSYDHRLLDLSAKKIVDNVKKTGSQVNGPVPLPTENKNGYQVPYFSQMLLLTYKSDMLFSNILSVLSGYKKDIHQNARQPLFQ